MHHGTKRLGRLNSEPASPSLASECRSCQSVKIVSSKHMFSTPQVVSKKAFNFVLKMLSLSSKNYVPAFWFRDQSSDGGSTGR